MEIAESAVEIIAGPSLAHIFVFDLSGASSRCPSLRPALPPCASRCGKRVLGQRKLSLAIDAGERRGITGPNGGGQAAQAYRLGGTAGVKRRRSRGLRFEDALAWRAPQPRFACRRLADAKVPSLRCHCQTYAEARLTRCACRSAPVLEATGAGAPPFAQSAPWQENPAVYEDFFDLPEHVVGEIMSGRLLTHPRPAPRQARVRSSLGLARAGRWAD